MPEEKTGEITAPPPVETTPAPVPDSAPSAEPQTPEGAAKAPEPTVEDIVKGVLDKQEAEPQPAKEVEEGSLVPPGDETEGAQAPEAVEGPVPYTRFKEVNEKVKTFEQELASSKPLIEAATRTNQFLQQNGITQEEYQDALDTLVLLKTDPRRGMEKLKPLVEQLSQFDEGYMAPDLAKRIQGLKTRVDEGELSAQAAKELEEAWRGQARYEAQQRLGQRQGQVTEQQRQQQAFNAITNAATQWETAKRAADPDYKPKAKADEPDGLFEIARKGFMYEIGMTAVKTPQDVTNLLEKAYKDAKLLFTSRLATKPTAPAPNSNRSTQPKHKAPQTDEEVVAEILRQKHGIVYAPRVAA